MVPRKLIQEWLQSNKARAVAKRNAEFQYAIYPKLFEEMLGETVGYSEGYWLEGTKKLKPGKAQQLRIPLPQITFEAGRARPGSGCRVGFHGDLYGEELRRHCHHL